MQYRLLKFLLASLLLLFSQTGWSQQSDRNQAATIEADRVEFDDQKKLSVYRGNVIFIQGSTKISAEQMTLYNKKGQLDRLRIEGSPATFSQLDDDDKPIDANSTLMHYHTDSGLLKLRGNAQLTRPGESIQSEQIDYNSKNKTVLANSTNEKGTSKGRVKIILLPNNADGSKTP